MARGASFNFLREKLFSKVAAPFYIPQQCKIVSLPSSPLTLDMVSLFNFSNSNRCSKSISLWICISLMSNDIEQLYMYLFAILIPSLVKCLLQVFSDINAHNSHLLQEYIDFIC